MTRRFDILIAGAGITGGVLAALLARDERTRDLAIAVVDKVEAPRYRRGQPPALRVSALSRASQAILQRAGAWGAIAAARVCPYTEMRVWDAAADGGEDDPAGGLHIDSAVLGEPDLGHIVENDLVISCLHEVLAVSSNVTLVMPAELERLQGIAPVRIELGDGSLIETRVIAGCDGAGSRTRQAAGIEARRAAYGQRGVVAVADTEKSHRNTAWQRFMPGGPLAFLPLADGASSIVWSRPEKEAASLVEMSVAAFSRELTVASAGVLGDIHAREPRGAFPLHRLHARNYCKPGVVLAGDACHVVHPLAGQGANLGLLDAAALAQVLAEAVAQGEDPGDLRVLRRYERWRKGDNLAMLAAMDGLSRLFDSDSGLLGGLRRRGMAAVDRSALLKHRLARHAMGMAGELPEAAKNGTVAAGFA